MRRFDLGRLGGHGFGLGRSRRRVLIVTGALATVAVASGSVLAATGALSNGNPWPYAGTSDSPIVAAVGDISCQPGPKLESEKASDTLVPTATSRYVQASTDQYYGTMT